ncbi:hypothetical protein EVG20_g1435, partial [Dentipellis fragilis]
MAETTTQTETRQNQGGRRGRGPNRRRGPPKGGPANSGKPRNGAAPAAATSNETAGKEVQKDKVEEAKEAEEVDESRICWICAEPVKYFSVSECNHRTCHVCALRLRALYKKMECTFCKESQTTVIFTESVDKPFTSYTPEDIPLKDTKLSICFETQEMMEDTLVLLRFNCPDPSCDYTATGWNDLKLHARGQHGKLMCDLCIRHKKVFAHEHALYSPNQLSAHLPSIPQRHNQKQQAQTERPEGGVHPLCEFCRECYFSDDELYSHMRERHEECFICKRNEVRDQYFKNYDALEKHFEHAHHPCRNSSCQARKFVVFGSLLDLQAHMVEEHGAEMSSRDKKNISRVNAGFEFQEVGAPSSDPAPRATTSRRERFGAHLTNNNSGNSGNTSPGPSRHQTPSPPPADMDPVTAERQNALYGRLRAVAPNPTNAVAAVKLTLRSYLASESGPRDLISTVWNILDRDLDNTASIVNLLVDLIDDDDKKTSLLGAWNGFKIEVYLTVPRAQASSNFSNPQQRRQFPDLVPTTNGDNYAGVTGGRVINIKQSTAGRANHASRAVWDRVAQAASSAGPSNPPPRPPERFPALQATASSANSGYRQQSRGTTAWSASASGASRPKQPKSVPSTVPAARREPAPVLSPSLFPELPTALPTRSKAAVSGRTSLQNILGSTAPATSAWAAGGSGANAGADA